jgi:hypothetical protein
MLGGIPAHMAAYLLDSLRDMDLIDATIGEHL